MRELMDIASRGRGPNDQTAGAMSFIQIPPEKHNKEETIKPTLRSNIEPRTSSLEPLRLGQLSRQRADVQAACYSGSRHLDTRHPLSPNYKRFLAGGSGLCVR